MNGVAGGLPLAAVEQALTAVAPFFGIIALGWLAARRGWFAEREIGALNRFVFTFALPPLLFQAMSAAPDASAAAFDYLLVYGGATLALYILARIVGRLFFGLRGGEQALFGHASINGNVGFLGLPLALAVLGSDGVLPTALALTFDILIVMTLTVLSLEASGARPVDPLTGEPEAKPRSGGVLSALRRALINPILIASLGGFLWGVYGVGQAGLALPEALKALLDVLGQAAAPGALFAVGAMLARGGVGDRRLGEMSAITVIKLIAHPAAVIAAFMIFAPETQALWVAAAALAAACPSSNNGAVFAETYGVYRARAAAAVLITSVLGLPVYVLLAAYFPTG